MPHMVFTKERKGLFRYVSPKDTWLEIFQLKDGTWQWNLSEPAWRDKDPSMWTPSDLKDTMKYQGEDIDKYAGGYRTYSDAIAAACLCLGGVYRVDFTYTIGKKETDNA